MADTGWQFAGTGGTDGSGDRSWVNTGNITADDASYAQVTNVDAEQTSNFLVGSNFGLSVPSGATIDGIQIRYEWYGGSTRTCEVNSQRLRKAGVVSGTGQAGPGSAPFTPTVVTIGGASDLWGTTWSSSDVNNSGFGFQVDIEETMDDDNNEVYVDYIQVKVHYTEAAGGSDLIWPIT